MRLITAAVLVLVVVFVLRWWLPGDRLEQTLPSLPDTRFNYTLSDFQAHFYAADGRQELLVQGPRLVHDQVERTATLDAPVFRWFGQQQPWDGLADQALFERDGDVMTLSGAVRLEQQNDRGRHRIETERLQHQRAARTIVGDQPVQLDGPGTLLTAGGLTIRLDDDTLQLSDQVHGQIQRTQRQASQE